MLAGIWILALLPLMDLLIATGWTAGVTVPAVFELGGFTRRLDETFLSNMGVYPMVVFCIGVVLLFSKERGRQRGRLDWTRRWGVICSYVVSLLNAVSISLISALVLLGIAACFLSIPPKFQPGVTQLFLNGSVAWIRHGVYSTTDAPFVVMVAFSSIVILLGCIALFDALRSSGRRFYAAILLAPLILFSLVHLIQVGRFCFGFWERTEADRYWLGVYFQPSLMVRYTIGDSTGWNLPKPDFGIFLVEAAKWCIVLVIAIWLSVAQILAWRRGKKRAMHEPSPERPV